MSITLNKKNFIHMIPKLYTMLWDSNSLTIYQDEDEVWWSIDYDTIEKDYQNWEYITVPQEAIDDPDKFLEFINNDNV
jgi:hypothetical protein